MYCSKCGAKNDDNVMFCAQCGIKLNESSAAVIDRSVAKEAVRELVKDSVGNVFSKKTAVHIQSSWQNFGFDEKLITLGAVAVIVGFFLPWTMNSFTAITLNGPYLAKHDCGWIYILPAIGLISLILIFSGHQKSSTQKILSVRWQIIIGMFFATIGFLLASIFQYMLTSANVLGVTAGSVGSGMWAMTLGGVAIMVGAVRFQKKLLQSLNIN
ncbi:MAG: zinc ribbon domain-containing protein [Candidatus Paceibacterota bacterium]|jgi:hypothetical protein